jgi:hypothetical protein
MSCMVVLYHEVHKIQVCICLVLGSFLLMPFMMSILRLSLFVGISQKEIYSISLDFCVSLGKNMTWALQKGRLVPPSLGAENENCASCAKQLLDLRSTLEWPWFQLGAELVRPASQASSFRCTLHHESHNFFRMQLDTWHNEKPIVECSHLLY